MTGRIFGLDYQLIVDACILAINILVLFVILSKYLFKSVRNVIEKRQALISNQWATVNIEKESTSILRKSYEEKIDKIELERKEKIKDADNLIKETQKRKMKELDEIIAIQREEAIKEGTLIKKKLIEEGRQEIIGVSAVLAAKIIEDTIREQDLGEKIFVKTLEKTGERLWENQQ